MYTRFPNYAPLLLLMWIMLVSGCDSAAIDVTAPGPLSSTEAGVFESSFTAEPATVRPTFLPAFSCRSHRPFEFRVTVHVGGRQDAILRTLRFRFTDSFGVRTFPEIIPVKGVSTFTPLPTSMPIPIPAPGSAALPQLSHIPVPGQPPVQGMLVRAGKSRRLPFVLKFGCGVFPKGTLVVQAEGSDMNGRPHSANVQVRVEA